MSFVNKKISRYFLVLIFVFCVFSLEAQKKRIQIVVVNDKAEPLAGVTIKDKSSGETEGSTDDDGRTNLTLTVGQILTFSSLSYSEKDVKVPNSETMTVTLEQKDFVLQDVFIDGKLTKDVQAEPELTVVGNTMYVKNLVRISQDLFEKNRRFILQPYLMDVVDNKVTMMSPVVVDGDEYTISQRRLYGGVSSDDPLTAFVDYSVEPKKNNTFYVTDSVSPVNVEHDFKVIFLYSIENYKKQIWTKVDSISKGVINPLRFYDFDFGMQDITDPRWFPQPSEALLPTAGAMNLEFETGQAKINMKNQETASSINSLRGELDNLDRDPNTTLKSFSIQGTASPDGDYKRNQELAQARMKEVSNLVLSVLSRDTRSFLKVETNAVVATWNDVYDLMMEDGRTEEAAKVKEIIDKSPKDINYQGARMRSLKFYKDVISAIYLPRLRKVEYTYEYSQFRVMTDSEIESLYKEEPEKVDRYGYSRLFESTADTARLRCYFNESLAKFPRNNYLAANKLACLNIRAKKFDPQVLAPYVKEGAPQEVMINQIITCLKRREFSSADSVANFLPINVDTEEILATVEIFNGKYDNAEMLQAKGGLNEVLILLTRGINELALEKVKQLSGEEPINNYIRAVCLARNSEPIQAQTFLRIAVMYDESLAEIAAMDGDLKDVWEVVSVEFE